MNTQPDWDPTYDEQSALTVPNGIVTDIAYDDQQAEPMPTVAVLNPDQVPDLDNMDEGSNLSPEYWEATNPGDTRRGVLIGWSKMKSKNADRNSGSAFVDMAVFQNKQGIFTNAGASLTQQLRHIPLGTPMQITYEGKERTNNGFNVNKFRVISLVGKPISAPKQDPAAIPGVQRGAANLKPQAAATISKEQFQDAVNALALKYEASDKKNLDAMPAETRATKSEEVKKKRVQKAQIGLAKTALKGDDELRHTFVREHFTEAFEGSLTELDRAQLGALADTLDRPEAIAYVNAWVDLMTGK